MKYEPPIDRTRLIEVIRTEYRLPAETLTFVPVGFAAVCYIVGDADGTQYFLKVWPDAPACRANAARQPTILRFVRALHDRNVYPRVPYPLSTQDGALWIDLSDARIAMFPYIQGCTPSQEWPPALWDEWARTMATIHRATPALTDVLPPRETFDFPLGADLVRGLAAVEQIGPHDRPGLRELRRMMLAARAEILDQLARLHHLQEAARRTAGPFALCHTDMGGENLLVGVDGRLYVLDWDEAMVAPPEHDLHEARWGDLERFLDVYTAAGGIHSLQLELFAFHLLRRHLGDMTVRLLQMLAADADADTSDEQDAEMLTEIETWGFTQWRVLDKTLDSIAAALQHE